MKQPEYLYSPRKKRGQRDNAERHLGQVEFLSVDIKKFYPSTTERHVWNWFRHELGMKPNVAGMLTKLLTVDGAVYYGSPVTPVLCALVHRRMFNAIDERCMRDGLKDSLWVDDLTVSGSKIEGSLIADIKRCVRKSGLRAHKVKLRSRRKPFFITGVGISEGTIVAPRSMHLRIKKGWKGFHSPQDLVSAERASQQLLSVLGSLRHIVGGQSEQGRRAADSLNIVRQKLLKRRRMVAAEVSSQIQSGAAVANASLSASEAPW